MSEKNLDETRDWRPQYRRQHPLESAAGSNGSKTVISDTLLDAEDSRQKLESDTNEEMEGWFAETVRMLPSQATKHNSKQTGSAVLKFSLRSDRDGQVHHYQLRELLGSGGMGHVFSAIQSDKHHWKAVAIKFPRRSIKRSESYQRRVAAEPLILSQLNHRSIIGYRNHGLDKSGRMAIVMEKFDGESITNYSAANQLTFRQKLNLFLELCSAVQYCHEQNIVHRDIKPGNILVNGPADSPQLRLIDFGVSKDHSLQSESDDEVTGSESTESFAGTLQYMSPEQADAGVGSIDARSDIYSLGVLLFELLSGDTPISRSQMASQSFDEIFHHLRQHDSLAGEQFESAETPVEFKAALQTIVAKCLQRQKHLRFASVSDLVNAIQTAVLRPIAEVHSESRHGEENLKVQVAARSTHVRRGKRQREQQRNSKPFGATMESNSNPWFWKVSTICLLVAFFMSHQMNFDGLTLAFTGCQFSESPAGVSGFADCDESRQKWIPEIRQEMVVQFESDEARKDMDHSYFVNRPKSTIEVRSNDSFAFADVCNDKIKWMVRPHLDIQLIQKELSCNHQRQIEIRRETIRKLVTVTDCLQQERVENMVVNFLLSPVAGTYLCSSEDESGSAKSEPGEFGEVNSL